MQNNSSQPKNKKSTACKTRPTLVEKMAILEEIYAWVSPCVFVLAAVSWSINQSINQSIDQSIDQSINRTIINWKMLREFTLEFLSTVFIWRKKMFWCYVLQSGYFRIFCVENKRKEIIDWRGALCSDSWQLCWKMRRLDRNLVTWSIAFESVDCIMMRTFESNKNCCKSLKHTNSMNCWNFNDRKL